MKRNLPILHMKSIQKKGRLLYLIAGEVCFCSLIYGPADATATPPSLALLKSRPFWYRLTHRLSWKRGQVPVLTAGNNYWDSLV